jgi:hypothetical protein
VYDSACECAVDPVTGEDYLLTCVDELSLYCNNENTVCARRSSGKMINKYGQIHSSFISFQYVSGGRDEMVILLDLGSGGDCSVLVNDTQCNGCGPISCLDESGIEYAGTAVDCENVEVGASFDDCGGNFFVETGVLEVASVFEFTVHTPTTATSEGA